mmetsp:Transcript_26325/g.73963  ORF Transcript_26325/g.73963 Transcript_26325/m.73963 type:complete len:94 (+) Transcript_26325:4532-4813(+)
MLRPIVAHPSRLLAKAAPALPACLYPDTWRVVPRPHQIVLYLGTSEFHLIYKNISRTAQGNAVYGVSLGAGSHQDEMSPRKALKCGRNGAAYL